MVTKQEAEEWYRNQIKKYQSKKDDEEYRKMQRRAIKTGSFIMFDYKNPKTKQKLSFFDSSPVILIFGLQSNDMWGFNLHYIPTKFRKIFIAQVIKMNKMNIKNNRRFEIDYRSMLPWIRRNGVELMIKRYKVNRITSLKYIKGDELQYVAELPLENFMFPGKKMTEDELYRMIYGHAKKTKQSKNKRF